jgi:hypothetical protein
MQMPRAAAYLPERGHTAGGRFGNVAAHHLAAPTRIQRDHLPQRDLRRPRLDIHRPRLHRRSRNHPHMKITVHHARVTVRPAAEDDPIHGRALLFAAARYRLCCHLAQPAAPVIGGRPPGRPDDDLDTTGSTARAPVDLRGRQRTTYCADFIAIEHVSSLIEGTDLAICERCRTHRHALHCRTLQPMDLLACRPVRSRSSMRANQAGG